MSQELTNAQLDLAVALLEGWDIISSTHQETRIARDLSLNDNPEVEFPVINDKQIATVGLNYSPSKIWSQAGPIIAREGIVIMKDSFGGFYEPLFEYGNLVCANVSGSNYLEVAMKAYLKKKSLN